MMFGISIGPHPWSLLKAVWMHLRYAVYIFAGFHKSMNLVTVSFFLPRVVWLSLFNESFTATLVWTIQWSDHYDGIDSIDKDLHYMQSFLMLHRTNVNPKRNTFISLNTVVNMNGNSRFTNLKFEPVISSY